MQVEIIYKGLRNTPIPSYFSEANRVERRFTAKLRDINEVKEMGVKESGIGVKDCQNETEWLKDTEEEFTKLFAEQNRVLDSLKTMGKERADKKMLIFKFGFERFKNRLDTDRQEIIKNFKQAENDLNDMVRKFEGFDNKEGTEKIKSYGGSIKEAKDLVEGSKERVKEAYIDVQTSTVENLKEKKKIEKEIGMVINRIDKEEAAKLTAKEPEKDIAIGISVKKQAEKTLKLD